eukprot:295975-Amphidinium_carterae.1
MPLATCGTWGTISTCDSRRKGNQLQRTHPQPEPRRKAASGASVDLLRSTGCVKSAAKLSPM